MLQGHLNAIYALESAGKWLLSGSQDRTVNVWDTDTDPPTLHSTLTGHSDRVFTLASHTTHQNFTHNRILSFFSTRFSNQV